MTEVEIKKTLVDKNNIKVTTVKRLGQTQAVKFNVIGKKPSDTVTFEKKGQKGKLHTLKVLDYKPSTVCYRCGMSDHIAKHCKATKEVCPICCENHSMKEHKEKQMTKIYCNKCDSSKHTLLKCKRKQKVESVESPNPELEVNMETTTSSENKDSEVTIIVENDKEDQCVNNSLNKDETPSLGSLQKQIDMILGILRKWEPKTSN